MNTALREPDAVEAVEDGEEPRVLSALDEEFAKPSRVSFFERGPAADERVCEAVWNMFVKDSNSHGYDARSRSSRAASKSLESSTSPWVARAKAEVAEAMATKTSDTGELLEISEREGRVLDRYRALLGKLGREPSNPELAEASGIEGASAASRAMTVSRIRARLVELGLAAAAPKGGKRPPRGTPAKATKPPPSPPSHAKPKAARVRRRQPKRESSPTRDRHDVAPHASNALDVLRSELATIEHRADALRDAIGILEAL